jgi:hypothetical protein
MIFMLRGHKHFWDTIATKALGLEVLEKVKTAPVEHGKIIVNYSLEGMCIFDVLEDTEELRRVEFTGTAA